MEYIKLSEICDVRDGTHDSPKYVECGFPLVTSKNIVNSKLDLSVINYICKEDYEKINARSKVDIGDIIMPMIGTIGKPYVVKDFCDFAIKNVALIKFPNKSITNKYLWYFLISPEFNRYIAEKNKGGTQKFLALGDIRNLMVPKPEINEQNEIVKNLDKIYSIIELREKEISELDNLIKARFVELFGDPSLNTKGYPIKNLPEIAEYWNGLTYKPEDVADEGTIVLRSSNIQNAQLNFEDIVRVTCNIGEKKYVQDNDILMCSRNGSSRLVGKVALIKDIEEPMSFGAFMMIIRSQYYPYLMTFFQMPAFRAQITTGATTTINQITGRMLDNVKLPVPEKAELDSFISFIEQIDKSKFVVQKSLDETKILFDSLMQEYFG